MGVLEPLSDTIGSGASLCYSIYLPREDILLSQLELNTAILLDRLIRVSERIG